MITTTNATALKEYRHIYNGGTRAPVIFLLIMTLQLTNVAWLNIPISWTATVNLQKHICKVEFEATETKASRWPERDLKPETLNNNKLYIPLMKAIDP